jgi:hypothetical protein
VKIAMPGEGAIAETEVFAFLVNVVFPGAKTAVEVKDRRLPNTG